MSARPSPATRPLWWIVMGAIVLVALGIGVFTSNDQTATNQDRVTQIAKTVRCPVCAGESVAESNAEISKDIRLEITTRVEKGESDQQIRDELAARFGNDIILIPPKSGVGGLVWVIPVVLLVVSFAGLAVAFRRWQEPLGEEATDADRALVARALADGVGDEHGEGSGR